MGGEGAGGCGHELAAFKYALNTWRSPGWDRVWAVGVVRAREVWARIGSLFKYMQARCG